MDTKTPEPPRKSLASKPELRPQTFSIEEELKKAPEEPVVISVTPQKVKKEPKKVAEETEEILEVSYKVLEASMLVLDQEKVPDRMVPVTPIMDSRPPADLEMKCPEADLREPVSAVPLGALETSAQPGTGFQVFLLSCL